MEHEICGDALCSYLRQQPEIWSSMVIELIAGLAFGFALLGRRPGPRMPGAWANRRTDRGLIAMAS